MIAVRVISMCDICVGLLTGLVSGLVAGIIVYLIISCVERRRWSSAKGHLVFLLNRALNVILSSFRSALDIKPPLIMGASAGQTDIEYSDFISQTLLDNFDAYRRDIEHLRSDKIHTLLTNLRNANYELRSLSILFISFRAADPWYVESIFTTAKRIEYVLIPYDTFPELGKPEYDDAIDFQQYREFAAEDIFRLLDLTMKIKSNPKIKDIVRALEQ